MYRIYRHLTALLPFLFVVQLGFTNDFDAFYADTDEFLSSVVEKGLVNYKKAKSDIRLEKLIRYIANSTTSGLTENEQLAFYINAYNLYVIHKIGLKYPVKSPMDIDGFFDRQQINMAGEMMTLNDLENKKIRPLKDARIHFVLVCAAKGCPKIAPFGYHPEKIQDQLQDQTVDALNDDSFIKVNKDQVQISEIFKWYKEDFGASDADIITYINTYRSDKIPDGAQLGYYTYNWQLNDKK